MTRRSGFTLVELLIVISIIVILITLLIVAYPMFDEARKNYSCQQNMKSIYGFLMAYATRDTQGRYPYPVSLGLDAPIGSDTGHDSYFYGPKMSATNPWEGLSQVNDLMKVGAAQKAFWCPFDPRIDRPDNPDRQNQPGWTNADSWKKPFWVTASNLNGSVIYSNYALLFYAGWQPQKPTYDSTTGRLILPRPDPATAFDDGRLAVGGTSGDAATPLVADLMNWQSKDDCAGWYHGGGVDPATKDLTGLFNAGGNTLLNNGSVVAKTAADFDQTHPALTLQNSKYKFWFSLTR